MRISLHMALCTALLFCLVAGAEAAPVIYRVRGEQHNQYRVKTSVEAFFDLSSANFYGLEDALWLDNHSPPAVWPNHTQVLSLPESINKELFPVSVRGTKYTIKGGASFGMLHHLAPWHVWKKLADGAGLRIESTVSSEVYGMLIKNHSDGIEPRGIGTFYIHDVCTRRIHDDAVENDEVRSGVISNSYFETHTFLSASGASNPSALVKIDHCLVHLMPQPHQGANSLTDINTRGGYPYPDGLGNGSMFKFDWGTNHSGRVQVSNTIFLIERHATSSNYSMQFAPGTYSNVTVVWLGPGSYPFPAPPGVTITRDRSVFDRAAAQFFTAHPDLNR